MDTIRIAGAQSQVVSDQPVTVKGAQEQPSPEVRILADWELVLASGGDGVPVWQ